MTNTLIKIAGTILFSLNYLNTHDCHCPHLNPQNNFKDMEKIVLTQRKSEREKDNHKLILLEKRLNFYSRCMQGMDTSSAEFKRYKQDSIKTANELYRYRLRRR